MDDLLGEQPGRQDAATGVRALSDGVGRFEGDDEFEGRPIKVRFVWSEITDVSARWHQDFSDDGGQTWETNWVMDFTRI